MGQHRHHHQGAPANQSVCFHTDNMGVVAILEKRSARQRCLYFYAAFFRFDYVAHHVPGVVNVAVDAISRNNLTLFSFSTGNAVVNISAPTGSFSGAAARLGLQALD